MDGASVSGAPWEKSIKPMRGALKADFLFYHGAGPWNILLEGGWVLFSVQGSFCVRLVALILRKAE